MKIKFNTNTMKNKKIIPAAFASILMVVASFTASNSYAQTNMDHSKMDHSNMDHSKMDHSKMDDCCMMKDGKMMVIKDGKTTPMEEEMTMKNGTKCMTNGMCTMKDGKKMQMKDGECMDMSGMMEKCSMMDKDMKKSTDKKTDKN